MPKIGVIQDAPVLLDREGTVAKAVELTRRAAGEGAQLVILPESFIAGYPTWIWRLRPGTDMKVSGELHERLVASAVDLETGDLDPLRDAARELGVAIVCGINEREGRFSRTTLYNTVITIGAGGEILNRHRKMVPTNPERMVWGMGNASGLRVVDTPCGRLGGLICWENYMPLARYTLYAEGVELYVAPTWDSGEGWIGAMRHIAREGRCWVVGCGTALRAVQIPDDFPERQRLYPDPEEWVNAGDSVVVEPGGRLAAGPLHEEAGVLVVDIDPARVAAARRTLDVAGHYARPDIFDLRVSRRSLPPLVAEDGELPDS